MFFALWPDEAMQAGLAAATRDIVAGSDGAAVPPSNYHFTLAFLGAVPESRIARLNEIAGDVAAAFREVTAKGSSAGGSREHRAAPVVVTLDHIDHWRRSEILCATSSAEPAAAIALAETLKGALTSNGFAPDLKPFRAHATLARKVRRVTRERNMPPVRWGFSDFRLIESRTAPAGSIYSSREIYVLDAHAR